MEEFEKVKSQKKKIDQIRTQIDQLDTQIIQLLEKRLIAVKEIGILKREQGIEIEDNQRESFLEEQLKSLANTYQLRFSFLKRIWEEILQESYRIQRGYEKNE
jgi:chorismate mutase